MTAHTLKLTSSFLVFLAVALMAIPPALARDHFVDPASVGTADGSKASPWRSLQDILNEHVVLAGDRVVLAGGSYGRLVIQDKMMSDVTSVVVADGQQAIFENVEIMGSANWVLSGLTVTSAGLRKLEEKYHVRIDKKSRNIKIEEFTIYTVEDISDWSADDWNEKALDGIFSEADYTDIRNNNIRNVNFGISTLGVHSSVVGNNIENFSGDGLRGLGDHSLFEENVVKNCYQVNPNHSDGFQSWSTGADGRPGTGVIKDVTLRRNLILNYEDFNQRYACKLEGIELFDGVYEDWTIENNIIEVGRADGEPFGYLELPDAPEKVIFSDTFQSFSGYHLDWLDQCGRISFGDTVLSLGEAYAEKCSGMPISRFEPGQTRQVVGPLVLTPYEGG